MPKPLPSFMLMPLQHSENLTDQERSVAEFRDRDPLNYRYAILHRDQIKRFGRFPGRNQALGRVSTPEEREAIERGETYSLTFAPLSRRGPPRLNGHDIDGVPRDTLAGEVSPAGVVCVAAPWPSIEEF